MNNIKIIKIHISGKNNYEKDNKFIWSIDNILTLSKITNINYDICNEIYSFLNYNNFINMNKLLKYILYNKKKEKSIIQNNNYKIKYILSKYTNNYYYTNKYKILKDIFIDINFNPHYINIDFSYKSYRYIFIANIHNCIYYCRTCNKYHIFSKNIKIKKNLIFKMKKCKYKNNCNNINLCKYFHY